MATKASLRKLVLGRLRSIEPAEVERQSKKIFQLMVSHEKFREAKFVSLYLSTNNEVDTIKILEYSLEVAKKRCFVPFIDPNGDRTRMLMVELESMRQYEELPVNRFGIKEMTSLVGSDGKQLKAADKLDLVIVPGVAFSLDGRRLGHGKGYYDRFLSDWERNRERVFTIGLALREQLVKDPLAETGKDYTLDEVLTDS